MSKKTTKKDLLMEFSFGRGTGKTFDIPEDNNGLTAHAHFIDDAKNMKELSTNQAYKEYITNGKISILAEQLGVAVRACSVHRNQVKNDIFPSVDLMERRLIKAGYIVLQEKLWIK